MNNFDETQMRIFIQAVMDAVRYSRKMLMRPTPDYKSALLAIDEARALMLTARGIVGFYAYNETELQGQGPREARPTSPSEDDPA